MVGMSPVLVLITPLYVVVAFLLLQAASGAKGFAIQDQLAEVLNLEVHLLRQHAKGS